MIRKIELRTERLTDDSQNVRSHPRRVSPSEKSSESEFRLELVFCGARYSLLFRPSIISDHLFTGRASTLARSGIGSWVDRKRDQIAIPEKAFGNRSKFHDSELETECVSEDEKRIRHGFLTGDRRFQLDIYIEKIWTTISSWAFSFFSAQFSYFSRASNFKFFGV